VSRRSAPKAAHQRGSGAPATAPGSPGRAGGALAYAAVATLVAALPLVFDPRLGGAFREPKLAFAEILGLASLAALAFAGRLRPGRLLGAEAALVALPIVFAAALLAPLSAHPGHLAPALASLAIGAACLVGWSVGFPSERLRALLRWGLPAAGATGLLGLTQALGWYQPFSVGTEGVAGAERLSVIALAGNPGDLGASLVLPALVAQAELARKRGPFAAFALFGCVAGIAASQTLSAVAALLLGSLILWSVGAPWRQRAQAATATVGVLLVATLAIAPARERLAEKARDVASGDWNATLTGRLDGWRAAVEIFRAHPMTGSGLGTFAAEFATAKARLLGRNVEFFREQQHPVFSNAHSEPLEVAAELGLVGLLALAWALWRLGVALRRVPAALAPREAGLAAGGVTAFALMAAFGFPFRVALVAYPALVLAAWIFAGARREEPGSTEAATPGGRVAGLLLGVALAAVLLLRLDVARDRLEGRLALRSVELRSEQILATGKLDPRLLSAHLAALDDAQRRRPADVAVRIARGNQYLLLGSLSAAIDAYRDAQALERRPETHLNLGQAYARSGCEAEAENEWSWAVRLDPTLRRQLPRGWRQWGLEERLFASGFECDLETWDRICLDAGAGCRRGRGAN